MILQKYMGPQLFLSVGMAIWPYFNPKLANLYRHFNGLNALVMSLNQKYIIITCDCNNFFLINFSRKETLVLYDHNRIVLLPSFLQRHANHTIVLDRAEGTCRVNDRATDRYYFQRVTATWKLLCKRIEDNEHIYIRIRWQILYVRQNVRLQLRYL